MVATKTMPRTLTMTLQRDECFDIDADSLTGVNDADYRPPFQFTGKLNKLTLKRARPQLSPSDIKTLAAGCAPRRWAIEDLRSEQHRTAQHRSDQISPNLQAARQ